jgi:YidC/Oxa1 family membrane protein insertase
MNQTRSVLLFAWLAVAAWLFIKWNEWNTAPHAEPAAASASLAPNAAAPNAPSPANLPSGAAAGATPAALPGSAASTPVVGATPAAIAPRMVTLSNDELRLSIDLAGGRIAGAQLLQYTVEKKKGSPNVVLFDTAPASYYVADAGLIAVDAAKSQHELPLEFHTVDNRSDYALAAGAASVSLPLEWRDPASGLSVRRTLTLRRGSYTLDLSDTVANTGSTQQQVFPFVRLSRVSPPPPPKHSFMTNPDSFSFVGAAWYTPEEKFEKTPFRDWTDTAPPTTETSGGWIGMLQHHFVTAWVPSASEKQVVQTSQSTIAGQALFQVRSNAAPLNLAPGRQAVHESRLWVGPKLQAPLKQVHETLPLIVDYGRLTFISQPIFWLLSQLHKLIGNWGWAIIAIVLVLKALLYWPSKKQYQSMAKMRAVQPRIEALKERYGDDKQALNVAMFELYKKEKVNPAAGCWPILVQMPIFLGLYWVLVETVELRQAPWMGWIQNLTGPDPYFVLPALNLLVMYATQRLTPTPGMDPMQRRMMQMMPLVFGVMMAFFPAGLVLYWVTNGALGLLQQWFMMRRYGVRPGTATVAR